MCTKPSKCSTKSGKVTLSSEDFIITSRGESREIAIESAGIPGEAVETIPCVVSSSLESSRARWDVTSTV